jgi:hypothetical protein
MHLTSNFRCQKLEAKCSFLPLASYGSLEQLAWESYERVWYFFRLTFHATPKLWAWGSIKGQTKQIVFLISNFQCYKLEVKQSNILRDVEKPRAQKLVDFKISSSSFYYYIIPIISLCCKVLQRVHLQRYFILFQVLHVYVCKLWISIDFWSSLIIIFSLEFSWSKRICLVLQNYASLFVFQFIISCKFHHPRKVLSWFNKGYWRRILGRYFHSSLHILLFMFDQFLYSSI